MSTWKPSSRRRSTVFAYVGWTLGLGFVPVVLTVAFLDGATGSHVVLAAAGVGVIVAATGWTGYLAWASRRPPAR
jgi:hypothetical protein